MFCTPVVFISVILLSDIENVRIYEYNYICTENRAYRKGRLLMKIAAKIFEKATVRGLADYLIYGLPPEPDERDYKARLDETYDAFERIALKYDPDTASDLLSTANDMTCENACVYLEIGIQAGFLLIADMMKNIQCECRGDADDEDIIKSRIMEKEIKKALEILSRESAGDADIKKACEILGRLGDAKTEPKGEEQ